MVTLQLKPNKEKSLIRRHPWIFSGALSKIPKNLTPGETVDLVTKDGSWYAKGAISPASQISVRVWTFDANETIDQTFFHSRIKQASQRRRQLLKGSSTTAFRLINAESDGLPGLTVDQYNDFLVMQCMSTGIEFWKNVIVEQLNHLIPNSGIFERSDSDVRTKENLKPIKQVLSGQHPPSLVEITEENVKLL
ncbi:23S rRNA (cytosine(1962)-C(5))-methyltransferase RlmI, partial [bacterium]|nr:23S rRNA (cytosine(1962)-C(5))-methyltransferase RlmI [bacterium]